MRLAPEAKPFALPPLVAAAIFAALGWPWAAAAALLLTLFLLYFFRDPSRAFSGPVELVIAAANGVVTVIDTVEDPAVGPGPHRRIATFLSAFDVHVQRAPVEGKVAHSVYQPGRKVAAFRADADKVNENHLTVLERPEGDRIGVRQIAGLLARRVVPYLRLDQQVERGQRLGIIKFGSRVDLVLPASYQILVEPGQRLVAGATPVAMPTDPSTPPPEMA